MVERKEYLDQLWAYLRSLGLDNIIQKEYDVRQSVYELGQKEYMLFRIYNRDGYVNIIDLCRRNAVSIKRYEEHTEGKISRMLCLQSPIGMWNIRQ